MKFRADQDGFVTGIRFYKTQPTTRAPTPARCGAAAALAWHRDFHRRERERLAAGELCVTRWRSRPTPPTSCPTTRRTAGTPPTTATSRNSGVDNSPLHRVGRRRGRRQRAFTDTAAAADSRQQLIPVNELLGRRRLQHQWRRHDQADCHRPRSPLPERPASRSEHDRHRHLQRARPDRHRRDDRSRPAATAVAGHTSYDAATRTVTFTPTGDAGAVDHLHTVDRQRCQGSARQHDGCRSPGPSPPLRPPSAARARSGPARQSRHTVSQRQLGGRAGCQVPCPARLATSPVCGSTRAAGNTGTHTGSLWNTTGTKLGTVTFTGETATGWQQATLSRTRAVTANTTYVASYYAPVGRYAVNTRLLRQRRRPDGPLTALAQRNRRRQRRLPVRRAAASRTAPTSPATTGSMCVFDTTAADTTAPTRDRQGARARRQRCRRQHAGELQHSPNRSTAARSAWTLTGPGSAPVPGNRSPTTPATQTATFTPIAALANSTHVHGHRQRRQGCGGQHDGPGQLVLHDRGAASAAARPGSRRAGRGGHELEPNQYSKYLAEILRTEGLNEFATVDCRARVTATVLGQYDVVVLGQTPLTAARSRRSPPGSTAAAT